MAPTYNFVSLFGVELDLDLLPHWIDYYLQMRFDAYHIFLHCPVKGSENLRKAARLLSTKPVPRDSVMIVEVIDEAFFSDVTRYSTELRTDVIRRVQESLNPRDYIIVADSDEFQRYPVSLSSVKELIGGYDIVQGSFNDRWGDALMGVRATREDLDSQFPHSGDFYKAIGTIGNPPRFKTMAHRNDISVTNGSHRYFCDRPFTMLGGLSVDHYHFRHSFLSRMAARNYVYLQDLYKILRYFGEQEHPEARMILNARLEYEKQLQQEMGWIPARSDGADE